jgi:hypothetical protein
VFPREQRFVYGVAVPPKRSRTEMKDPGAIVLRRAPDLEMGWVRHACSVTSTS